MFNYSVYSRLGNNQKCLITLYIVGWVIITNNRKNHKGSLSPQNNGYGLPTHSHGIIGFDHNKSNTDILLII